VDLLAWLQKNAGPGTTNGDETVWDYEGFTFSFRNVEDAGEDSVYGFEISKQ
jgi:hypothetical protein